MWQLKGFSDKILMSGERTARFDLEKVQTKFKICTLLSALLNICFIFFVVSITGIKNR